ncbi:VOC family protein [Rhodococcus sp. Eu-32]|uniref:VOC family protein n=1 Tax=Rhodococcus sp. Eu-32 TaxID=1017319 RepID=UPI000DF427AB|nr:VOC family protein [Rhodococcus sp. Eu-32]RRQ29092.1 VOC family protein [Rhodococcus sp. Eu-32]
MSRHLGPLRQLGYVVDDIDTAMKYWTDMAGVGPFFYVDDQPLNDFVFRGEPSTPRFSVALAQSGNVQIELIQQHNDQPSAFREFTASGRTGLQHVAYWTTEFDRFLTESTRRGLTELQSGRSGSGAPDERFVYFEEGPYPGTVIEVSEVSGRKGDLFRAIESASQGWDGTDPVRDMRKVL